MTQKAVRENLEIVEVIQESKSAKKAAIRDGYKQLLHGLEKNQWDAILTFSPDRLSRNAGDLGQLVDLMDEGKVAEIRTHDQIFKNTPDEKFLLMLLCGQAKLENDYRGTNVKRGMRAVCHTGKRPGPTPLGYKLWYDPKNKKAQSKIIIDDERVHHIQNLFRLVGENGLSTREAMRIVNNDGFMTTKGNHVSIGTIIKILHDPFYTGEFEYPKSSGTWYQGSYESIVSKELYETVQVVLQNAEKRPIKSSLQTITKHFCCKKCGSELQEYEQKITCLKRCFKWSEQHTWKKIYKAIDEQVTHDAALKKIELERRRFDQICTITKQKSAVTSRDIIEYLIQYGTRFDRHLLLPLKQNKLRI